MLGSIIVSQEPFTRIWSGYVSATYYHVLGHEDGKVSLCRELDYAGIERVCGKSIWVRIQSETPSNVSEVIVPAPFGHLLKPMKLKITDHRFVIDEQQSIFIRLACDNYTGAWVQFGEPEIQDVV